MICQKPGQITLAIEIRHRICVQWLQERAHMTVPKGRKGILMGSGDAGLPLVELKFSVFQSDCRKRKWVHVFLLSDSLLPLPMISFVILAFLGQPFSK